MSFVSRLFLSLVAACSIAGSSTLPGAGTNLPKQTITGVDGTSLAISLSGTDLILEFKAAGLVNDHSRVFFVLGTHREIGAAVLPFSKDAEGSTVFLPFKADTLISVS